VSEKYLYAGLNAGPLASGRWAEPGEPIASAAVDLDHDHDAALIADGVLIDTQPAKAETKEKR
jgi:hypothetical protein